MGQPDRTSATSDATCDVLVLGSGAAGLVAAIAAAEAGASVRLYEKADAIGGTTALSGGACWVPCNDHMAEAGTSDAAADARAYLESMSFGLIRPDFAEVFVADAPATFRWLERSTPLRMKVVAGYPDYHPERLGGKPGGGRTLEPDPFPSSSLGDWAARLISRRAGPAISADMRSGGAALVAALLRGLLDRGVEPVCRARAVDLLVESGRVAGARIETDDGVRTIEALSGVVLATGGFEWSSELARGFLRGPMTSPASLPTCTGDGLLMAMRVGASLSNMAHAWWVPAVEIPGDVNFGRQRARLVLGERTLPRSIMVNRAGVRFTNEAAPYNAIGGAFHQLDAVEFDYPNLPCWLIFDHEYLERYGLYLIPPGGSAPAWLPSASTVAELAEVLGIDAAALSSTVTRWNTNVAAGLDPDFRRGDSAYDRYGGDATVRGQVASTLGPIDSPPYYAVAVHSGALSTSGGPRTDVDGQVLDTRGEPIRGLFAAGNVMAAPTGMSYLGAGGTLGPIITFARRAGRAAAAGLPRCTDREFERD